MRKLPLYSIVSIICFFWLASTQCIPCGYEGQLCCALNERCTVNSNNEALCAPIPPSSPSTCVACGIWELVTETEIKTQFRVFSTFMATGCVSTPPPTTTPPCDFSKNESPCGDVCCSSGYYCYNNVDGVCRVAGAPLRPTNLGGVKLL
jgi:hypothetical protein